MSLPPLEPLPDSLPSSFPLSLSEPLLTATDVSLLLGIPRSSVHQTALRDGALARQYFGAARVRETTAASGTP